MALRRKELLGSSLLLWAGAGLLALYLLCNPGAVGLCDLLGPTRLQGAVLALVALGLALLLRHAPAWSALAAALLLSLLPPPLGGWLALAAALAALAGLALRRRLRTRPRRSARRPTRPARMRPPRRPARHLRRGRAGGPHGQSRRNTLTEGG